MLMLCMWQRAVSTLCIPAIQIVTLHYQQTSLPRRESQLSKWPFLLKAELPISFVEVGVAGVCALEKRETHSYSDWPDSPTWCKRLFWGHIFERSPVPNFFFFFSLCLVIEQEVHLRHNACIGQWVFRKSVSLRKNALHLRDCRHWWCSKQQLCF